LKVIPITNSGLTLKSKKVSFSVILLLKFKVKEAKMSTSRELKLKKVTAGDSSIRYFGKWETDARGQSTQSAYSSCYFTFYGEAARVYALSGPGQGICDIWLDGEYQAGADCYAEQEGEFCLFDKSAIGGTSSEASRGTAAHNLVILAKREKNARSSGNKITLTGAAAVLPVDYPAELKRRMNTEYAAIKNNLKPWKSPGEWKPVELNAEMPRRGVTLLPGIVRKVYDLNIQNIKYNAGIRGYCEGDSPDFLKGLVKDPFPGWGSWLPGSNEGRMLAGAAGALCWEEDPELRGIVDKIISDIKNRMRDDGYFNYYPETESYTRDHTLDDWADHTQVSELDGVLSERKNYDRVFWTRGMLAAIQAGNPDAPVLLRRMYDWFNRQEQYLNHILLGGNATNGTPGGPLVYHSDVGKPEDIITSMRYLDQDFWFQAFAEGQPMAFSHYPGERPHCYDLLPVETIADEYIATGDQKYFDALMGAWEIYYHYYKHTGGPTGICETNGPYPPGSRYITTGHNGETCGSVFWEWINQRLMLLYPNEEKYIAQIEEVVYNTLVNCRDEKGFTRYHIRLHGKKDGAFNANTCCQVSSTIAISAIPQYIYLTGPDGVFVNLFIPSRFDSDFGKLSMETDFPQSGKVQISVEPRREGERFNISVRIPGWASDAVTVLVNGEAAGSGTGGERIVLNRAWKKGDVISFVIPFGFSLVHYTGTDQAEGNLPRYTLLYGPILMALDGGGADDKNIPRLKTTPEKLIASLKPSQGKVLHFPVPGTDYTILPYWDAKDTGFTCVPIIEE
jgi:hypothetical protein